MSDLAQRIAEETEVQPLEEAAAVLPKFPEPERILKSQEIIREALVKARRACIAFSGGRDSLVLLKLVAGQMPSPLFKQPPVVIYADSQMEYPESREYIEKTVASFGLTLRIGKANVKPIEQWERHGWPLLGKMPARIWNKQNKTAGFLLNCSECCRNMKIKPARRVARNLGIGVQMTGQRGGQDDQLRAHRERSDGPIKYQQRDKMWIANPLINWKDEEIKGFIQEHNLPEHPATKRGESNFGCVFCGGGSAFINSQYSRLRKTWPEAWARFMVTYQVGIIILAVKYKTDLQETTAAVSELGGLRKLAEDRPWIFDYTRITPIRPIKKSG